MAVLMGANKSKLSIVQLACKSKSLITLLLQVVTPGCIWCALNSTAFVQWPLKNQKHKAHISDQ